MFSLKVPEWKKRLHNFRRLPERRRIKGIRKALENGGMNKDHRLMQPAEHRKRRQVQKATGVALERIAGRGFLPCFIRRIRIIFIVCCRRTSLILTTGTADVASRQNHRRPHRQQQGKDGKKDSKSLHSRKCKRRPRELRIRN